MKGQFFIISAVVILTILFIVSRSFTSFSINTFTIEDDTDNFNNLISTLKKINITERNFDEIKQFFENYYNRKGISLTINKEGNCIKVIMLSRTLEAEKTIC